MGHKRSPLQKVSQKFCGQPKSQPPRYQYSDWSNIGGHVCFRTQAPAISACTVTWPLGVRFWPNSRHSPVRCTCLLSGVKRDDLLRESALLLGVKRTCRFALHRSLSGKADIAVCTANVRL